MYRYGSSKDIVYTPEDLILFKASPFAFWMERLTLEHPRHGIAPDADTQGRAAGRCRRGGIRHADVPTNQMKWEDLVQGVPLQSPVVRAARLAPVAQLVGPEDEIVSIDASGEESYRRERTREAMRSGANFITNAQLAVGPLATRVDLLLRSPGISELGDYFYLPVDLGSSNTLHRAFSLAFAADLLHDMQGTLPPQMLVMHSSKDFDTIQTDKHIHYLRAVRRRFTVAQLSFRKHCMPDPSESAHFGRWSHYAGQVMRRKARTEALVKEQIQEQELSQELAREQSQEERTRQQRLQQLARQTKPNRIFKETRT